MHWGRLAKPYSPNSNPNRGALADPHVRVGFIAKIRGRGTVQLRLRARVGARVRARVRQGPKYRLGP